VDSYIEVDKETHLADQRRFILIVQEGRPPGQEMYVSVHVGDKWYYILKEDDVSQRNFALLGQFLTMQAIAPQTPPVSPSILVGPR
jgi:hypothetical protein